MIDFLSELRFSNSVENQSKNIVKYRNLISEPLFLLYKSLLDTVMDINLSVETKPSRCVSTPYTDRRFSSNVPLKEYMYIRFKHNEGITDIPGLYFDMGAEHYGYGVQIYNQTSSGMDKLREKILEKPGKYSEILEETISAGFNVKGEKYKRDHFQALAECKAKEILNHRGFYIEKAVHVSENVFSSALADEISCGFRQLRDFYKLLEESENG